LTYNHSFNFARYVPDWTKMSKKKRPQCDIDKLRKKAYNG